MIVRPGEIVGIAGVSGNGQRELADVVLGRGRRARAGNCSGARTRRAGRSRRCATKASPRSGRSAGLCLRAGHVGAGEHGARYRPPLSRRVRRRLGKLDADMQAAFGQFGFAASPVFAAPIATLSAVTSSAWFWSASLPHAPKLIVALYPTRGLYARSTLSVYALLREARDRGAAVLMVSEDLDESFRGRRPASCPLSRRHRRRVRTGPFPRRDGRTADGRRRCSLHRHPSAFRLGARAGAGRARGTRRVHPASGAVGKDPLKAYLDTLVYLFGNAYGFSELVVRMIPLLLTAVAVALPTRIGLINVGGEGQLYMGAWAATAGALAFSRSAGRHSSAGHHLVRHRRRRHLGADPRHSARAASGERDDLDLAAQLHRAADRDVFHLRPLAQPGERLRFLNRPPLPTPPGCRAFSIPGFTLD